MQDGIEAGYETFVSDEDAAFGAVRTVSPDGLVVYVGNAGEFYVPTDAVLSVHSKKVVLDCRCLELRLRHAIAHAHDAKAPGR